MTERYIVLIGKECIEEWENSERKEWNRPIREFFERIYPECETHRLDWNASGDTGYGYGITPELHKCVLYSPGMIEYYQNEKGFKVLTRDQVVYSQNLQNILKE